ncbi:phage virion morphogenesis protein [Escherichia coli]|uniref:Phage virion morphogenesis protein n=1 Tax=Escherichia coli TaxID=562 RepID=A0A6D0Y4A5_ECOLX|nr:phage virion morphogenesis protein [Escherichia coli]EKF4217667.1 phage virion morphogenesis protein [Escherichia coli O8]EKK2473694.1 phage virion morphogenesis protein [Escherichia coli O91]EED0799471.1 phage virion morphogenesis protein [Escherichia coli]EEQ9035269.1 phage virion morphogenesis protein [Escherichia coli]EES5530473.1 phage virion morphogenesis protein [Escherichia coli]
MSTMTMNAISFDDRALQSALHSLEMSCQDLTPAMRKIAGALLAETQYNFEDEGNPPWPPSLAAQARGGQTLQDSGHLARSVTTDYGESHVAIGSNLAYAAIHQKGGKAGRKRAVTLPARPYLPVDEQGELSVEAKLSVLDTILRHLESAARR